ncbi:MAG: serpin family protein [Myxococcaceae bacterium]|nr:serpin family protein [Myxococcaceae bacterium]
MNFRPVAALLGSLVLLLQACGHGEPPNVPAPGELAASSKQRIVSAAPQGDIDQTVDSATTFAFDVYRKLGSESPNTAFSPYSVGVALSLTYPGARGTTQKAFEDVLHLKLDAAKHHRAMNGIDAALQSRGVGASGRDGKPFRLRANNQLFGQKGQHFESPFLDVLAEEYGAGLRLLDFHGDAEGSRKQINDWVSTNTEQLIPELLKQGTIDSGTVLALVNTLYFNGAWKKPFSANATADAPFKRADGSQVQVKMMSAEDVPLRYADSGGTEVFEVPYQNDEVSMVLLVPPAGKLGELEQSLDGAKVRQLIGMLQDENVGLKLPRFEARTQVELKKVLGELGLGVAFGGEADLSGMTGEKGLRITAVVHEAVVKTDEAGTEAAAATAVVVGRVSLPQFKTIDRAFVYLIRDRATGAVLFVGRVGDPSVAAN